MNCKWTRVYLVATSASRSCFAPLAPFASDRTLSTTCYRGKSEKLWLERQNRDPYVKASVRLNYRARSAFKLLEIDDEFGIFARGQIVIDCGAAPGAWSQVALQRLRGPPKFRAFTVRQLLTQHKDPVGFNETELSDFRSAPNAGLVLGLDLSPIVPLTGAAFISKADIFDPSTRHRISRILRQHQKLLEDVGESGAGSPAAGDFSFHDDDDDGLSTDSSSSGPSPPPPPRCVDVVLSDMAPNCMGQSDHDHDKICRLARGAYDLAAVFLKAEGAFVFKLFDGKNTRRITDQLKPRFSSVRNFKPEGSRTDSSEIFIVARGFRPPERREAG